MKRFLRGASILWVVFRFGLDGLLLDSFNKPWLRMISRMLSVGRKLDAPRGQRLREALESLGPIFVKFGQVLSTRRDLLPPDIADELALLQDRVPPFDPQIAIATIERAFRRPVDEVFTSFDRVPVASASIARRARPIAKCSSEWPRLNRKSSRPPSAHLPSAAAPTAATSINVSISKRRARIFSMASLAVKNPPHR